MHEFTLILNDDGDFEEACERLFEAGCDDASPVLSKGVFRLEFAREGTSFREAVLSAVRDVETAGCRVRRVEAENLVTAAEIGRRTDRTREAIRLYANGARGPRHFPRPIGGGHHYDWREVAHWFNEHDLHSVVVDPNADDIAAVNLVLELRTVVSTKRELDHLWRGVQVR